MAGLWYTNVGYGREELAKAAYEQLQKLPNYPLTLSHEPAVRLGEKLNDWLDDEYVFFFSNSGSEANEVAFKMTRQYHLQRGEGSRHKFIARYRAYHGTGGGALAATGMGQRKYRYEPLSPGSTSSRRCATGADTAPTGPRAPWSVPGRSNAPSTGRSPSRWRV